MTADPDCLFCRIVAGEVPAHFVVDEGPVRAFLDHRPLFPGHTLVVPADHIEHLNVMPDDLTVPLWDTVRARARGRWSKSSAPRAASPRRTPS